MLSIPKIILNACLSVSRRILAYADAEDFQLDYALRNLHLNHIADFLAEQALGDGGR